MAYPYWAGKGCPAASLGERTAAESSTTARLRVMSKCARSAYDLNGSQLQGGHSGQRQKRSLPAPLRPRLGSGGGVGGSHQLDELLYSVSAAVALCGLYQAPLDAYPRENPHLKRIVLCLDADAPGREAAERFRAEYGKKGYDVSTRTPAQGKDWNAYLQQRGQARERGDQCKTIAR